MQPLSTIQASRHKSPLQVQFGGPLDLVSSGVALVEGPITSLLVTDALGMSLPRTWIEYTKRGLDTARETAIREFSALIGLTLLVGWISRIFIRGMGDKLNRFNPMAIPSSTWLSADSLDAQQRLYAQVLQKAKSPEEARRLFIKEYLTGLRVADPTLVTQSRKHLNHLLHTGGLSSNQTRIGQDRLSPQGIDALLAAFDFKSRRFEANVQRTGTRRLNELTHLYLDSLMSENNLSPAALEKAYKTKRLALGLESLKTGNPDFADAVYQLAVHHGLDHEIHLKSSDGKRLLKNKHLDVALGELKTFLEQVVDRATDLAAVQNRYGHKAYQQAQRSLPQNWQALVHQQLFGPDAKRGLWRKFVNLIKPHANEGLIPGILRQKTYFSWIPLTLTIGTMMSIAFLNNWLTQRKYDGKVFFPGEGVPPEEPSKLKRLEHKLEDKAAQVIHRTHDGKASPQVKPSPLVPLPMATTPSRPVPTVRRDQKQIVPPKAILPPPLYEIAPGTYVMNPFSSLTIQLPPQVIRQPSPLNSAPNSLVGGLV